jgi:RND family efflux transporter MFP subunit
MGRRVRTAVLFFSPVVVGLASCGAPQKAPPPRAVGVSVVELRDAGDRSRYTGSLAPWEQIDLGFAVPGKVQSIGEVKVDGRSRPLQEGDPVKRGELLATLDDGDFRMKSRAAAANVQSVVAQLDAAESALRQATLEVERARKLRSTGSLPAAELDRAESAFAAARSNVEMARAQRLSASEQSALARSTLGDTRIESPIDGIIARRLIDVGESVAPGMAAFTVIDVSRLRVLFGVPGHQLAQMKLGRKLPVHVEGLMGEAAVGTISKVLPMADPLLRSFSVEVTIANPDNTLRPGMVASIAAVGDDAAPTLIVPLEAITRSAQSTAGAVGGFSVWVIPAGASAVAQRPVELGDLFGNSVAVTRGLAAGEVVVVKGAQLLREGELVEAMQ